MITNKPIATTKIILIIRWKNGKGILYHLEGAGLVKQWRA